MKHGMKWAYPAAIGIALVACSPAQEQEPARDIGSDSLANAVLIDITELNQTFQIYPSYATERNFTGAVLPGYEARRVLLHREAAVSLARAQEDLKSEGLGLRVFDGYRPVRATLAMVDWAEANGRVDLLDDGYIARSSRHNLGVAVDLTLIDLETGREMLIDTSSGQVRDGFDREVARREQYFEDVVRQARVDHVDLWTDQDVVKPLGGFFRRRIKRLNR